MNKVFAHNRGEWRSWLEDNHTTSEEIWLVYYKKSTDLPTIAYSDSVEEAICFGWIDGLIKKIDEQTYARRFTPRRKNSKWSPLNIQYAKKLIESGKMTAAGLAAFEQREHYDPAFLKARTTEEMSLTPEIEQALKENRKAWENFTNLAPSHKKQYIGWLTTAKRQETRERRLLEAIRLLENNEKLGMK